MITTKINNNDIYAILPEGILVPEIITRFKKAIPEGSYVPTIIDDIRLLEYQQRYDSHLSQLEAGSDQGSGGRNPKISKTRKRSSTSSKRLPNDLRKHQRLPYEYQLIHPYDHRKKSPPISYIYSPFRPLSQQRQRQRQRQRQCKRLPS